jgi:hypothetical protein
MYREGTINVINGAIYTKANEARRQSRKGKSKRGRSTDLTIKYANGV